LQYECRESNEVVDSKRSDALVVAVLEMIGAFLVIAVLIFNSTKTEKMGKQYGELNLTASAYTLFVNISAQHRHEFEAMYAQRLEHEQPEESRGFLFKKYIEGKLRVQGVTIARIDLVFDNKKMIELLEARGNAIKLEKLKGADAYEQQIDEHKQYQYHADVVGAFITYERDSDIKKIQAAFSNQDPAQRNQAALSFQPQRPVDPSDIRWKNMQIKLSERMVRGFLVCLTLLGLLYVSFLMQVLVSDWRFENERFERIDCGAYKQLNTRSIFQNKAYAAWTEYYV